MFKTKETLFLTEGNSPWLEKNKLAFYCSSSKQGEGKRRWRTGRGLIKIVFADVYIMKQREIKI